MFSFCYVEMGRFRLGNLYHIFSYFNNEHIIQDTTGKFNKKCGSHIIAGIMQVYIKFKVMFVSWKILRKKKIQRKMIFFVLRKISKKIKYN